MSFLILLTLIPQFVFDLNYPDIMDKWKLKVNTRCDCVTKVNHQT